MPKLCSKFYCKNCDYGTSKKSSYYNHLNSNKHKIATVVNQIMPDRDRCPDFVCNNCNKFYKDKTGLWRHNKKCGLNINHNTTNTCQEKVTQSNEPTDKDLIIMLIKKNDELQNMMMEVIKNGTHNVTNNTNSNNKTFNLNVFLNETCKDAMNIMDFVESIQLQLSDLENVGKLGYVEGITNIITKNLKALDVTQRPIHCTDKKREVLYIKDEDKWEKEDDDKKKIRKAIKRVAFKNHRLILKFKEAHPDCLKASSNYSDQYNKIIIESCGGSGDNDTEKEDKIIRNISKSVIVDK